MLNKYLIFSLLALTFGKPTLSASEKMGYGLELTEVIKPVIVAKWYIPSFLKKTPTCTPTKANLEFMKKDLVDGFWVGVLPLKMSGYIYNYAATLTVEDVLKEIEKQACQRMSGRDFATACAIKKEYFDKVPDILTKLYDEQARPYNDAIAHARAEWERTHDGCLLEQYS